jgi:predicted homoserine dehydrogenase-like protein
VNFEWQNPIRVGLIGAGFSGKYIAYQIIKSFPALRLSVISNRTIDRAREAYSFSGATNVQHVGNTNELEDAIRNSRYAVTEDASVVCEAEGIEAIIETTGTVEFAAGIALRAIENKKHVILVNVELDATLGPILKTYANRAGVVYTNSDGDEPGVAMNMIRFIKTIGLKPVVAGNLKGLYDPYRTPETQREFAARINQEPQKIASFADGTKLSMELTVLANATGFGVGKRGMFGPELKDVLESSRFFNGKLKERGIVDFLVGAAPYSGAFVLGFSDDPIRASYMQYLKMGQGPLYVFYTPFHLPQLEVPLTVARAVTLNDATVAPIGKPFCDAVTIAKRDLKKGEVLDGLGGFTCYSLIDDYHEGRQENALPIGVSEGCTLNRAIKKDQLITYADVILPKMRLCDRLREEQNEKFSL